MSFLRFNPGHDLAMLELPQEPIFSETKICPVVLVSVVIRDTVRPYVPSWRGAQVVIV